MEWGHAQSIFQLGAALNLVYYSFRDIRFSEDRATQELLEERADAYKRLQTELDRVTPPPIGDPKRQAYAQGQEVAAVERYVLDVWRSGRKSIKAQAKGIDAGAKHLCLMGAASSVALLLYSTYNYAIPMPGWIFLCATLIVFTPVALLIAYNLVFASAVFHMPPDDAIKAIREMETHRMRVIEEFTKSNRSS